MSPGSLKGWAEGPLPTQDCPPVSCPCQPSTTAEQGQPRYSGKLEWGTPQGTWPQPTPCHGLQPLGTPREEQSSLCVSPVSVCSRRLAAQVPRRRRPGTRGALCVSVWGCGAVLAASVLCVTLPSRGPVPSVPREPQPKSQGDGEEGGPGPPQSTADCSVSSWVFPREPEGQRCFPPHTLPLQAAFLLPQCLMPGHTATEYAIRVGDRPPRPHPTPGSPWTPKATAATASLPPLLPICLHTENGV